MIISLTFLTQCFVPLYFCFLSFSFTVQKNSPFIYLSSFFLYPSSFFFFILILCLFIFIFFSSMCHSRCCLGIVEQPSVPLDSYFIEVMINKDFWGLLCYFDKLSVTLNAIVSSGLLWIHQEDPEGHPQTFCAYHGKMPLIAQNTDWCGQCDQ